MTFWEVLEKYQIYILPAIGFLASTFVSWLVNRVKQQKEISLKDIEIKKEEQLYKKDHVDFIDELVEKFEKLQSKIILLQNTVSELKKERGECRSKLDEINIKYNLLFKENEDLKNEVLKLKLLLYGNEN